MTLGYPAFANHRANKVPFVCASARNATQRTLIPVWARKYESGDFDDDGVEKEPISGYEEPIAAPEWLIGRHARVIEFLRGAHRRVRSQKSASDPWSPVRRNPIRPDAN